MAAVAVGGAVGGVFAVTGHSSTHSSVNLSANSHREHHAREMRLGRGWSFSTLNNSNDPTFNQLLGINNRSQIAGYFGSGAEGHPNKGYVLSLGHASSFTNENFPTGIQTQVIGINDTGVSVGFWSTQNTKSMANNNFGFYDWHGQFHSVNFPTRNMAKPPVNQLLGVNDSGIAVGFYMGAKGMAHSYAYSIRGGWFHRIRIPGAISTTASGINNRGDIAGFYTGRGGVTRGFLLGAHGHLTRLTVPGASSTMAFGVNDHREVVGTYMTGSGNNAKSFGFIWSSQHRLPDRQRPARPRGHHAQRHQRCRRPGRLLHRRQGQHRRPAGGARPLPGPVRPAGDRHGPDADPHAHGHADRDHHAGPRAERGGTNPLLTVPQQTTP